MWLRGAAALQGGTQPWQAAGTLAAPNIPSPSAPVLPPSTAPAPQRSAALPVLLAGGLSKGIPIPEFPMGGMEQG